MGSSGTSMPGKSNQRLIEVVAQAAQKPAPEQEAFVRTNLSDSAEQTEALSLLSALRSAGGFMDRPTVDTRSSAHSGVIGEQPGSMIGRYRLQELIGEGGFGAVFKAEQKEPVRRTVAVKIIKLGMDTKQVVARFEAERQALAMMDHPNIAKVLDGGATEAGRPYFVMELVRGEPITRYCDAHKLSTVERLELFTQVCLAVQHAHQKGIIHRDIKPSNVLVCDENAQPESPNAETSTPAPVSAFRVPRSAFVKVIDFGIAKATSARLTEKTVFTEHRSLIGTPEYMSPEQADLGGGSGGDIDTRSDIYSLGVLLYELLTGVTPFDGVQLRSAAFAEIQRIIREVEPPKPSTRLSTLKEALPSVAAHRAAAPARLPSLVRGDLDWIVMKCLEKERSRRYDTAGGLAQDIERHLAGEPVLAAPPSPAYRFRKFIRRHRAAVTAGAAVAGALIAGLAIALWQAKVASHERDQQVIAAAAALASKKEAEDQRAQAEQIAQFQATQLKDIDVALMGSRLKEELLADVKSSMSLTGAPAEAVLQKQDELSKTLASVNMTNVALQSLDENIFRRALEAVAKEFKDQPLVKARLLQTLASTMRDLGLLEKAQAPQTEALEIRRRELGDQSRDTLNSMLEMAILLRARGKLKDAESTFRETSDKMEASLGHDDLQTIAAIADLGELLQEQGHSAQAEPVTKDALERTLRTKGENTIEVIALRNNLGFIYYNQGKYKDAGDTFAAALAASRAIAPEGEGTLSLLNNLASVYQALGRLADAEPLFREAMDIGRRVHGDDSPATLNLISNYGYLLYREGKLDQAEPYMREALDRRRRILTADHWDSMQSLDNLGQLLTAQGKFADAKALLDEALERRRRVLGPNHRSTLQSMDHTATLYQREGKLEDSEALFRECLDLARKIPPPDHPDIWLEMNNLAATLMLQIKFEEALPLLRAALDGRLRKFGKDSSVTGQSRVKLGEALTALAKFDEAETMLLEAEPLLAGPNIPPARHAQCVKDLIALYEAWDKADPGKGHDAKAAAWSKNN